MSNEEDNDEPTVMASRFQLGVSAHVSWGPPVLDDGEGDETTANLGAMVNRLDARRLAGQSPVAIAETQTQTQPFQSPESTIIYNQSLPRTFEPRAPEARFEPPKQYPFERPPVQPHQRARMPSYAEGIGPSGLPLSNLPAPDGYPGSGTHPMAQPHAVHAPLPHEPPREALAPPIPAKAAAIANPPPIATAPLAPAKPVHDEATTAPPFVVTYLVVCGLLTLLGLVMLGWLSTHQYF